MDRRQNARQITSSSPRTSGETFSRDVTEYLGAWSTDPLNLWEAAQPPLRAARAAFYPSHYASMRNVDQIVRDLVKRLTRTPLMHHWNPCLKRAAGEPYYVMIRCHLCNTDSVGLYCVACATRKVARPESGTAHAPVTPQGVPGQGALPSVSWHEVRSSALRFLDWSGFMVEERPDGLDWLVDGQRVQIRYTVGPETSLRVSLHTDLAEVTAPESSSANGLDLRRRAAARATRLNDSVPMSVIVASDNRLQLRCVVSITPTGRTMLRVLHTAALLHAYWGMRLRWELAKTPGTRVDLEGDGWPDPEVAPPLMEKALFDALLNDDQWLLSRWGSIRPHLTHTMSELGYRPGWGNEEVQFYNELPPDIAVAVLEPEHPTWSWLGRGVVIQARTLPGADVAHLIPNYSPQAPDDETLNALNTALFSVGTSVLKGFSAAYASQGGYQIDCWIPVAGVADPSLGDAGNATSLGNLAVHVAGAAFTLHRRMINAN